MPFGANGGAAAAWWLPRLPHSSAWARIPCEMAGNRQRRQSDNIERFIRMSLPHFDFPDSPHIAGDAKDDDAEVIDNLVESHAEPPTPEQMPTVPIEPNIEPPRITRLISNTLNVNKAWAEPTLLLPADPNRKSLEINVTSANATDVVNFADEKNKAQSASTSFVVVPASRSFTLTGHTGAVWVYAPNLVDTAVVTCVAVTS